MAPSTKELLLDAGMAMLLERGYHDLGIAAVLEATKVPKGSFYHYFKSKEDFALQCIDRYMAGVHQGLDACLGNDALPHLDRIRAFFGAVTESYRREGYLGCLLGGLGQELSGASEVFRAKLEWCLSEIGRRLGECLEAARRAGELHPNTDTRHLSELLVNCWEGAALRSRLLRDPRPLGAMLDFYFKLAKA